MKSFLIVFLLFTSLLSAQTSEQSIGENGTLFFKDGTQKDGLIRFDGFDVLFKKTKGSEEKMYNYNSVSNLTLEFKDGSIHNYHYELYAKGHKTKVRLVNSSKSNATLFFKDKTTKSGYIINIDGANIMLKEEENGNETLYNFNSVYKLILETKLGVFQEYQYRLIERENASAKVRLLETVIIGDVSLLCQTFDRKRNIPIPFFSFPMGNNLTITASIGIPIGSNVIKKYYLSKKDDIYATNIIPSNIYNSHFRKSIAPLFFKKCQKLMDIINNKEFGKFDFEKVVSYYNNDCKN